LRQPGTLGDQPVTRSFAEEELQHLGYRWLGDYDASSVQGVVMLVRAYLSSDAHHVALWVNSQAGDERNQILEFSTTLSPSGNITTNNSSQAGAFVYPPDKFMAKVPWKKSVAELVQLHLALCETAAECGFAPVAMSAAGFLESVEAESRREMELQVAHGRMKSVSDECYQITLKGAILITPRVWARMLFGSLLGAARRSDQSLRLEVRRRYGALSRGLG
jgi:hypothetical protein